MMDLASFQLERHLVSVCSPDFSGLADVYRSESRAETDHLLSLLRSIKVEFQVAIQKMTFRQKAKTSLIIVAVLLVTACATVQPPATPPPPSLPNGIAAGDVDRTSAVLWAHTTATGPISFTVSTDAEPNLAQVTATALDAQQPVTVTLANLRPGTTYAYRVDTMAGDQIQGRFRTAAAPDGFYGLRFGVSGDWRGSLAPFVSVRNAPTRDLDFFVELGDTIYADLSSPAVPKQQAESLSDFRTKHGEVYGTQHGLNLLADLRASTAVFATIDDHEVLNDFAGGAEAVRDSRFPETTGRVNQTVLYANALRAFHEFNPLRQEYYAVGGGDGRQDGARKLYRYRLFGRDAALFVLDARTFRDLPVRRADRNDPADVARFRNDTFRPGRTMLGSQQLADLKRDLLDAQRRGVTWKFIAIPEPIQHRGLMSAQDRFEGYAAERTDLLRFIDERDINNVIFIAADIHGTLVNNVTYSMRPDTPQLPTTAFEVTTGPVGYNQTLGPVVIEDGVNQGYVTAAEQAQYEALPVAPDGDSVPNDRDDFVKTILDGELVAGGFDPLGLDNSPVEATLLVGDYVSLHSYGWTEFEIDAEIQQLTVTTYGIAPYTERDLSEALLADVLARQPQVVSQFEVMPRLSASR